MSASARPSIGFRDTMSNPSNIELSDMAEDGVGNPMQNIPGIPPGIMESMSRGGSEEV